MRRGALALLFLTAACSPDMPEPDRAERLQWEADQANRAAEQDKPDAGEARPGE
ncbi:hypothetical protein [Allosphingosinicella vermicomposti]|uniref:hypothetical protein n=1 Tax=Allosphingosinicella vermicomposti TaxID=614671 RepID=UPI00131A4DBE|nr:hypothetical protein [Allosphingosinicella vermicomposti]